MTHTHTPPPTAVSAICRNLDYLPCEYFMVTSVFWTAHAARGAPLMRHDAPLSWSPHSRDKSHVSFFLLYVPPQCLSLSSFQRCFKQFTTRVHN